ncbi:uncharacterized protein DFL_005754 [Arthrobotrys flagrans]|uniref:Uncharacterized protein n=1 Tax=Arthrobotrys flagrans TaxID=97331 RepID=A0A436ZZ79_ARTFL|nr:hypothetical protein DFL_005754 [Arthrobotrys flagrans]
MNARLKSLHSVVDMPTQANPHAPVRMFHLSFRDFLSDRLYDNHDLDGFWIDEREAHRVIHKKCFELMSSPEGLRRDICNLKAPGMLRVDMDAKLIEQHLVPKLQYVCCYWVYRLQQSADDNGPADELLRKHTFHKIAGDEATLALVHDIKRLVSQSQNIISTLQGEHTRQVKGVAFSADGKTLASGPSDYTVKVWDTATGTLLQTLEHAQSVNRVTFSADDKMPASASNGCTVKVWDAATGALLQTLERASSVDDVALSTDGKMLASAVDDGKIRIWDVANGSLLRTLTYKFK